MAKLVFTKIKLDEPDFVYIITYCPIHNNEDSYEIKVKVGDYRRYLNGDMVQDIWPDMDSNDRERLISGACPRAWDDMFPEKDSNGNQFAQWEDN